MLYFNIDFKNKCVCSVLKNDIELKTEVNKMWWNNKKEYDTIIKELRDG